MTIRSKRCFEDQVLCADLIVLNKADLIDLDDTAPHRRRHRGACAPRA